MTLREHKIDCDGFVKTGMMGEHRFTIIPWDKLLDAMIDFNQELDELAVNHFDEEFIDEKNELVKKYLGDEFLPNRKK